MDNLHNRRDVFLPQSDREVQSVNYLISLICCSFVFAFKMWSWREDWKEHTKVHTTNCLLIHSAFFLIQTA